MKIIQLEAAKLLVSTSNNRESFGFWFAFNQKKSNFNALGIII